MLKRKGTYFSISARGRGGLKLGKISCDLRTVPYYDLILRLNFRLTTDVQDFKSSFKQTISQGLRAIAQLIGGSTSLYIISPALSSIAFVCIPTAVIIGSYVGSILRKKSREAQAQVRELSYL